MPLMVSSDLGHSLCTMGKNAARTILLSILTQNNSELGRCLAHVVSVV